MSGNLKRHASSHDSTSSPASKRACILLDKPRDEIQDSVGFITSGDKDDKQAVTKIVSTSRPPPPNLLHNESWWRKFVYGRLDFQHSRIREDSVASLRLDISQLVREWMPVRHLWEDLSEESRKEISSWASNAKKYIESNDKFYSNALFKGWIYHLLHENLFSLDCHEKWSSPDWAVFGQLQRIYSNHAENSEDADSPSNTRFHNWRRISSGMLFDMHKDSWHTEPGRLYSILAKHLAPLFLSESRVKAPDHTPHESLEWLVYRAIRLDAQMIHSAISITIEMADPATGKVKDFPFDRKQMLAPSADLTYSHVVDFIIEPRITIRGRQGLRPRKDDWKDLAAYRGSIRISEGVGVDYEKIHGQWKFLAATSQITGPAAGEDHDVPQPTETPEGA
ncbi:unnamed protein product [Clonostachys byssicola]|uniref:Uncharacterized protein n=1 Tax=Clonostachys byssicola TaxID=160290 RepID=A0A9N9U5C4_9HYPO|nr:unnamed protein product [Clonostachys byssicola]